MDNIFNMKKAVDGTAWLSESVIIANDDTTPSKSLLPFSDCFWLNLTSTC
jgi:hypothetical protein